MPQPRTWLKASKSAARPQHHEEQGDDAVDGDDGSYKCSQLLLQPHKEKQTRTPTLLRV